MESADLSRTISSCLSAGVLVFLTFGLYHRHRPRIHIPVMLACFLVDLGNVIYIEVTRGALGQTYLTAQRGGEWILKFHIAISVLCLVAYGVALGTGLRLLRTGRGRRLHRLNAALFLPLRVLNYFTSFYV